LQCGAGSDLRPGADIGALTSIGANCEVGEGSHLDRCIVMDHVSIGANVRLKGVILDDRVEIEDDVVMEARPGSTPVLAAGTVLKRGTRVAL
jgi:NDP-sugar pyrophosphorylase family protein